MEIQISNFKNEFNNITLIRSKIINVFETLRSKSDKLKILYSEFIKQNNSQLFIFGLDSFHFQSKLIDLEYDDMQRIFIFINNRMYCEYFKLYKLISSYVLDNFNDKKILEIVKSNNFPVYKDLEPFNDYKFETIIEIHDNILILLNSIVGIVNNRENELSLHKSKLLIGLNIDNFIYSFNYEIVLMREKVNLFLSCIDFFHKLHAKYLKRFSNKIQLMVNHINSDIHFEDNIELGNNENKSIVNDKMSVDDMNSIDYNDNNDNNVNLKIIITDEMENDYHSQNSELIGSGFNTPTNSSFKSIESVNSRSNKFKIHKIIKNGIKKVSNMFNGCNNNNSITNKVTDEIIVDRLNNNKEKSKNNTQELSINLNDFCDVNDNDIIVEVKPAVAEAPVEPAVVEAPVEPAVVEAPVEPAVVEAPVEAEVVEAPVEPVVEAPVEAEVVEAPVEAEVVEAPVEPEVVEAPVEPAVVEAPVEPEVVEAPVEAPVEPAVVEAPVEAPLEPALVEALVEAPVEPEVVETLIEPEVVEAPVEPEVVEAPVESLVINNEIVETSLDVVETQEPQQE